MWHLCDELPDMSMYDGNWSETVLFAYTLYGHGPTIVTARYCADIMIDGKFTGQSGWIIEGDKKSAMYYDYVPVAWMYMDDITDKLIVLTSETSKQ